MEDTMVGQAVNVIFALLLALSLGMALMAPI
jgi:hypothetical protein